MQLNEIFYSYSVIRNKYTLKAEYKRLGKINVYRTILLIIHTLKISYQIRQDF